MCDETHPIIAMETPGRCPVLVLIWSVTSWRSKRVLPQLGQLTYSVFVFLILDPCKSPKLMVLRNSRSSEGHSTRAPSPKPSQSKAPISVPVVITISSLFVPAQGISIGWKINWNKKSTKYLIKVYDCLETLCINASENSLVVSWDQVLSESLKVLLLNAYRIFLHCSPNHLIITLEVHTSCCLNHWNFSQNLLIQELKMWIQEDKSMWENICWKP